MKVSDIEGWLGGGDAEVLQMYTEKQQQRSKLDFLEIGSWKGKSGIIIASVLKENRRLWMIDHFQGSPINQYPKHKMPPAKHFRDGKSWAYPELLENILAFGVQNKVIVFPLNSVQAARIINEKFCFIFIDGDHSFEGVSSDFFSWFPHLETNGVIIFHDGNHPPIKKFCDGLKEREDLRSRESNQSIPVFERISE